MTDNGFALIGRGLDMAPYTTVEVDNTKRSYRHGRACPGYPRLTAATRKKDVDARDKRGHDVDRLVL
jgi:hypothetical protein